MLIKVKTKKDGYGTRLMSCEIKRNGETITFNQQETERLFNTMDGKHGSALFDDGQGILFSGEQDEM